MSLTLKDMRKRLARETGLNINSPNDSEVLDELINDAAQQLYDQTDLPRCLREESFQITSCSSNAARVALPERIGEIRGIRDAFDRIKLHDMRPKYNSLPWPNDLCYTFRLLRDTPICRSIDNAIGLYMVPLDGDPTSLRVSITGSTIDAQEIHAYFNGDGTGTAVGILWTDIRSITKDAITPVDVLLLSGNASGCEMSRITSYGSTARYIEVELYEFGGKTCGITWSVDRCIEVLYKPPFRPLLDDDSVFQCEGFDFPVIYKAVEIYRIRGLGGDATESAIAAAKVHSGRADDLTLQAINNKTQGVEMVVAYGPARWDIRKLRGLRRMRYGRNTSPSGYYS